jgi:hypothetical protein
MNKHRSESKISLQGIKEYLNAQAHNLGFDWELKIGIGGTGNPEVYYSYWNAELRITDNPNFPDGPDESRVFYVAGERSALGAAREVFGAGCQYLSGQRKGPWPV